MDIEGLLGFGVTFVLQSAVVLLASMFAFDVLHYFLHRWKKSRFRLLRRFARMHDVHHRFLTPRLKIDERYRWANLWCHVVPEFGTAVAVTLAFLLVFPWYPVVAILIVRLIMFVVTVWEEGMDFNHMATDRVTGDQGLWFVSPRYHAMHHVYPNNYYSSTFNVFDLIFGTTCEFRKRTFLVTGASGAFGSEIVKRITELGGKVETAKFGPDYTAGDYERILPKLQRADVLVLAHGAKRNDCWNANYRTFVDLIDKFIEIGRDRLTAPEVWALGSEVELHGDLGIKAWKEYSASKKAFAARARGYFSNHELVYRHIVPSAFTSSMGRGLMSARTASKIAIFFIRRNFTYVPVTLTTLAFWNYFRFISLPEFAPPQEGFKERGSA